LRFFWKIFFSTMLIACLFLAIGGYCLIDLGFRSTLERETEAAYDEADILAYTLAANFRDEGFAVLVDSLGSRTEENVASAAGSMAESLTISSAGDVLNYRLSAADGRELFNNSGVSAMTGLITRLEPGNRGYEIQPEPGGGTYIHVASPITVYDTVLYVECFRDIDFLFASRSRQIQTFVLLMLAMTLVGGVVIFFASQWLTRPIRRLSRAAMSMAEGHLDRRVAVTGSDELSDLSRDFNTMAERLEQNIEELREATRRQERFIGSFAHELKTPLTAMIGYADMLRSKQLTNEQVVLSANYIFTEGKRLEAMSMKLLNLIILKRDAIKTRDIYAFDFFDSLRIAMTPVFIREGIDFHAQAEDGLMRIEPDLMKTVCMNLLDNARKAIDGDKGRVSITGRVVPEGYEIRVRDNGKGMEPEDLKRITEAFYMVDKSRARAQGGAGLGLSICAEIVHLHGAQMRFESAPGQGTAAIITLKGGAVHE
jgi:signal transduction histidine kinase